MAACAVGAFGVAGNVITIAVLMRMRTNRNFNNLVRLLIVLQLREVFLYVFSHFSWLPLAWLILPSSSP